MEKKLLIQDMADAIATKGGITPKDAIVFVSTLFEVIEQALIDDKFIKIKGLGTFKIVNVNERESVDVNTGERTFISGHARVSFTPDSQLKELVNRPFAHFETVLINDEACLEEFDNVEEEPFPEDSEWEEDDHDEEEMPETADTEEPYNPNDTIKAAKDKTEARIGELSIPVYDTAILVNPKDEEGETKTEIQNSVLSEKNATEETQIATDENIEPLTASNSRFETEEQPTINRNEPVAATNETETQTPKQSAIKAATIVAAEARTETAAEAVASAEPQIARNTKMEDLPDKKMQEENQKISSTCCNSDGKHHVEYVLKEKRFPFYNIWKLVSVILFALLLLLLTYFAGYFRWFCPCETTVYDNPYLQDMMTTQECILPAADKVTPAADSMMRDSAVLVSKIIEKPRPTAVDEKISEIKNTKVDKSSPAEPQTAEHKKTDGTRKTSTPPTSTTTSETKVRTRTSEKVTRPAVAQQYDQVEGGKFEIVGTLRNYRVQRGESIRSIALKVYGSKGYAIYIATHNQLKNPNLISADTLLKLPELKRRDKK